MLLYWQKRNIILSFSGQPKRENVKSAKTTPSKATPTKGKATPLANSTNTTPNTPSLKRRQPRNLMESVLMRNTPTLRNLIGEDLDGDEGGEMPDSLVDTPGKKQKRFNEDSDEIEFDREAYEAWKREILTQNELA